ncbi:DUF357 domain-containing protein [Methanoculleus sp. FWC-SCC1]|uniref:DUF357 domain-containing protein n=1 Tax=Methanoculleus frigidifontis TaxID=2584085 RepID=A0ABT8M893_9EURY|nr:DUF357 domain-containing protein [Methanoculleus sp. FWC-SCC1]MDN7024136.1 DUF357 domain-containing protein [Methanoculleus sp. FWC-SCC1]
MTLEAFGVRYGRAVAAASAGPPGESPLNRAACDVLEMAAAYHADGCTFFSGGDPVNALASFAYGLGWLDAGLALGLVRCGAEPPSPDEIGAAVPAALADHLSEKTHRYERMLAEAAVSVEIAPDPASPLHRAAEECIAAAGRGLAGGRARLRENDSPGALARFSYGYGWLDAGVRAGLLRVTRRRDLFTV